MKRKQKITEFFFNEQDSIAEVFTHNTDLKKRLLTYAQTHPHLTQKNAVPPPGNGEKKAVSSRGKKAAVSCHAVTASAKQSFFFNEYCEGVPSFSRTFCPGQA